MFQLVLFLVRNDRKRLKCRNTEQENGTVCSLEAEEPFQKSCSTVKTRPHYLMRPNMDPAPPFMLDMMLLADAAAAALLVDEGSSEGVEAAVVALVLGVCASEILVRASCPCP